jgi:hypothetical protein
LPLAVFTPKEGVDPGSPEVIQAMLDEWDAARSRRATGYVGAALDYNAVGWSPEQLQLADARQHAVLEIARATVRADTAAHWKAEDVEARLPHLNRLLARSPEEALSGAEVVLVSATGPVVTDALREAAPPHIIDLSGRLGDRVERMPGYSGVGW